MHTETLGRVLLVLGAAQIADLAWARPAPQLGNYGENSGSVGGVKGQSPVVATPSGSLRGDASLQGGIARPMDPESASAVVQNTQMVPGQDADAKLGLYLDFDSVEVPQPIRGAKGQTDPGPRTYAYEKLNPDMYAPPTTDTGGVPNAMWPMGLSHNRLGSQDGAGWARQQNIDVLPIAKQMAGVDMRLGPNAYRELHWHTSAEWALVLKGCVRVAAISDDSKSFVDDLCEGDVWFFPAGIPHSIQAFDKGVEFLIVFDDGNFSEEETFLISETMLRNPVSVLEKNFNTDASAFQNLPKNQLFIFNGTPAPKNISEQNLTSSAGALSGTDSYSYHWSQQQPYIVPGGSVKILDPVTFPVASQISAALVTVQPGAMREIHWHPTSDEWSYFLQGSGRATVYAAPAASRTFDFTAGDVGYIPAADSHYVENTGNEDLVFLEVLKAPKFTDISVSQWLALTPRQVVKDHTGLSDVVLDKLGLEKKIIVPGNKNLTAARSV